MNKLLLLEDDTGLIEGLKYALEKNGFALHVEKSVRTAKQYIEEHKDLDLLLLDVSLPDGTGFDLCEYIRNKGNQVPIIFLTAADEEVNIIRGLDCGGDDYLTKPFKLGELCSRIKALLRRSVFCDRNKGSEMAETSETIELKGEHIRIDLLASRVYYKEKAIELTAIEYKLLCMLLRNQNKIITRQMILDVMWDGNGNFVDDNTLSVYVRRLREKVEKNPSQPVHLKTARGLGYMWEEKTDESDER